LHFFLSCVFFGLIRGVVWFKLMARCMYLLPGSSSTGEALNQVQVTAKNPRLLLTTPRLVDPFRSQSPPLLPFAAVVNFLSQSVTTGSALPDFGFSRFHPFSPLSFLPSPPSLPPPAFTCFSRRRQSGVPPSVFTDSHSLVRSFFSSSLLTCRRVDLASSIAHTYSPYFIFPRCLHVREHRQLPDPHRARAFHCAAAFFGCQNTYALL